VDSFAAEYRCGGGTEHGPEWANHMAENGLSRGAQRRTRESKLGLAPESEYRERVEKRRKARWAKQRRHVHYRHIMPMFHAQLDAELREERRALLK
jgi:hypothetical protein